MSPHPLPANDHLSTSARITKRIAQEHRAGEDEINLDELRALWRHYAPSKPALSREHLQEAHQ